MPNFDHPPDGLKLGQIVTSPTHPWEPPVGSPLDPIDGIKDNKKTDYEEIIAKAQRGQVGVWAQFVSSMFGGGVAASWATEHGETLEFQQLETIFFEPDDRFLEQSVTSNEKIREYISKNPRKSVYMITGLKIARGAKCGEHAKNGVGLTAKLGVGATAFTGVPMQGGPDFKFQKARHEKYRFEGSEDFIFAYRLKRIIVTYKGNIKGKRYEKGAETLASDDRLIREVDLSDDDEPETTAQGADEEGEIASVYLDNGDFGAKNVPFQVDSVDVRDEFDDENCLLIIPNIPEAI